MIPNRKSVIKKSTPSPRNSAIGTKRVNLMGQPQPVTPKKQKFEFPKQGAASTSVGAFTASTNLPFSRIVELDVSWRETIKDLTVSSKDFKSTLLEVGREKGKSAKLICSAVKLLLKEGSPFDADLFKEIMLTIPNEIEAKMNPNVFGAVFEMLNRFESNAQEMNMSIVPIALQLVQSSETWPSNFLNYVLYDCLGARMWVDKPESSIIVQSAFSLFGEISIPSDAMFQAISDQAPFISEVSRESHKYQLSSDLKKELIRSTAEYVERSIEVGSSKPLLRTLCMLCANEQFRLMASQKLESWLTNNKYQRFALELILFIASNIRNVSSKADMEILTMFMKIRSHKSRQVQNVFQAAIKQLVDNFPEVLSILTDFVIEGDFMNTLKAQTNINFLQFLFAQNSTEVLKLIAQKLVIRLEKPDQLKHVRLFVKEFYRSLTVSPFPFGSALLNALKNYKGINLTLVFQHCLDILYMFPFLGISPAVRDATLRSSETISASQSNVLERFRQQFQSFSLESITSIKSMVNSSRLDPSLVFESTNALLFLKPYQFYTTAENWLNEVEFNTARRIIAELPIDAKLVKALLEIKPEIAAPIEILTLLKNLTARSLSLGDNSDFLLEKSKTDLSNFDLTLFEKISDFEEFKNDLCLLLVSVCTVEKSSDLVFKYLEFIVENIDENSITRIAPRLSTIVVKSSSSSVEHKNIRQKLTKFFADFMRKLMENSEKKSNQILSPNADRVQDKLSIQFFHSKSIEIDADILNAIMELLCNSCNDEERRSQDREYLMDVWFPLTSKPFEISANDRPLQADTLFNSLKMKMMSARDERIVRVALNNVKSEEALKYIQTFALSPFSCTALLSILNNDPSIFNSSDVLQAVPFVQAYGECPGADQFLNKVRNKPSNELKMEVDSTAVPFVQMELSTSLKDFKEVEKDYNRLMSTPPVFNLKDVSSVSNYLDKILVEPSTKESNFVLSPNWRTLLDCLKNVDMARVALKFAHEHLLQMNREIPDVLNSLISKFARQNDFSFQRSLSAFVEHVKLVLPNNKLILAMLKSFSRKNLKPIILKTAPDVEMTLVTNENKKENEENENDKGTNKDLKMHWAISEFFEAVSIPNNPSARELAKELKRELTNYIKSEPLVFSRQLPLLFNHVQSFLKLNTRQAIEIDSYTTLVYVINIVTTTGQRVFHNTEAFETFLEIFLNSMAAHQSKSRQWESILERLTTLMLNYLNWNPKLVVDFVTRNRNSLHNLHLLFPNLRDFKAFIDNFPGLFRS